MDVVCGVFILAVYGVILSVFWYDTGRTIERKAKPVATITQPVKVVTQAKDIWEYAGKFTYSDVGLNLIEVSKDTADAADRIACHRRHAMTFGGGVKGDGVINYHIDTDFKESDRNVNPYEDGANDADQG